MLYYWDTVLTGLLLQSYVESLPLHSRQMTPDNNTDSMHNRRGRGQRGCNNSTHRRALAALVCLATAASLLGHVHAQSALEEAPRPSPPVAISTANNAAELQVLLAQLQPFIMLTDHIDMTDGSGTGFLQLPKTNEMTIYVRSSPSVSSASFIAEISVMSLRKLIVFII